MAIEALHPPMNRQMNHQTNHQTNQQAKAGYVKNLR